MTSQELKKNVAQKTGISLEEASHAIDELQKTINRELTEGKSVNIPGFGHFVMIAYPPRTIKDARNPAKTYLSLEKNIPRFRPSANFKEEISGTHKELNIENVAPQSKSFLY